MTDQGLGADEAPTDVVRHTHFLGMVLLALGAALVLAWVWRMIRVQQQVHVWPSGAAGVVLRGPALDISLLDRVDLFMSEVSGVGIPALVTAAGMGLRLAATRLRLVL